MFYLTVYDPICGVDSFIIQVLTTASSFPDLYSGSVEEREDRDRISPSTGLEPGSSGSGTWKLLSFILNTGLILNWYIEHWFRFKLCVHFNRYFPTLNLYDKLILAVTLWNILLQGMPITRPCVPMSQCPLRRISSIFFPLLRLHTRSDTGKLGKWKTK